MQHPFTGNPLCRSPSIPANFSPQFLGLDPVLFVFIFILCLMTCWIIFFWGGSPLLAQLQEFFTLSSTVFPFLQHTVGDVSRLHHWSCPGLRWKLDDWFETRNQLELVISSWYYNKNVQGSGKLPHRSSKKHRRRKNISDWREQRQWSVSDSRWL